jgi:putative toxin-antitoxin system antitoxin component (TIGR02293 family)
MSSTAKNDSSPKAAKSKVLAASRNSPVKAPGGVKLYKGHEVPDSERMRTVDYLFEDRPDGRMEVYKAIQAGLPLQNVLRMVSSNEAFKRGGVLSKIVGTSEHTLARRMKEPERALSAEQSYRALQYAEIMDKAIEVLGSSELAERWISQPALGLNGETPLNLIINGIGYELVNDFLIRMDYGVY